MLYLTNKNKILKNIIRPCYIIYHRYTCGLYLYHHVLSSYYNPADMCYITIPHFRKLWGEGFPVINLYIENPYFLNLRNCPRARNYVL